MLFFQTFPKIYYSLDDSPPIIITNIMTRVKLKDFVRKNAFLYYTYPVKDSDTPSSIAHKYYDDPSREWIIFLANDIMDPNYDWVLPYDVFLKFVAGKYGSIALAQSTIDHYEKIVTRTDSSSGTETIKVFQIDLDTYNSLPANLTETLNLTNGSTVTTVTTKNAVSCYDFEDIKNEAKRTIQLIGKQYVSEIEAELKALMK